MADKNRFSYSKFIINLERKKIYPYLYLIILFPFVIAYFVYPFIFTTVLSFTSWTGIKLTTIEFIGFKNFIRLFNDSTFLLSLRNTVLFMVLCMIAQNFFGFVHAYILNYSKIKWSKIWRVIIFFPVVVAPVIISLIWRLILSNEGLLNLILGKIGLSVLQKNWLGNPYTPMFMIVLVNAWQWTGYNMILFHAGFQSIPDELLEAAKIDGANIFQIISRVIIPLLTPIITIIIVLSIIGGFKVFDVVYVLTKGGPAHLSEVISTYLFYNAFSLFGPSDYGYAATMSLLLIIIIFLFSYLRIRFTKEDISD